MLIELLQSLDQNNLPYVSWKNNHELDLVLKGESDLDIFTPYHYETDFISLLKKNKWIEVVNPVADYPFIKHFYKVVGLKIYHLHVYFKIITGESWLKEYDFPIENFLMENRIKHSSGVFILNNRAQSFLFVLRHFLKGYSIWSRVLYKSELNSYKEEWNLCKSALDLKQFSSFLDLTPYYSKSGLENEFTLPDRGTAKRVRKELKSYLRIPENQLGVSRIKHFSIRFINKLFLKRKKVLPDHGFILAISGTDGVGKTTMTENIEEIFGSFLTVKTATLGKPQSQLTEKTRRFFNKETYKQTSKSVKSTNSSQKNIGIKRAVSSSYLAFLRYKAAKKAQKYRSKNFLVISDRWPTMEIGSMDGPKMSQDSLSGIRKILARIEERYYEKIPEADLNIILTVPVEVAIERNKNRIKEDKETDEEIRIRHDQSLNHKPKSKEILKFDNNGSLEVKRSELLELIQARLFQI